MSDKKHIDRLFQEKLKDFEATPNEAVWDNINNQLKKEKDDRKVIPIWWKFAGVAAGLILLLTVGNLFLNDSNSDKIPTIVETDEKVDTNNDIQDNSTNIADTNDEVDETTNELIEASSSNNQSVTQPDDASIKNNKVANSDRLNTNNVQTKSASDNQKYNQQQTDKNYLVNSQKKNINEINLASNNQPSNSIDINMEDESISNNKPKEVLAENKTINQNITEENKPENIINNKEEQLIVEKEKIPLTEDFLVNNADKLEKEKSINRWQINPNIAPVYYNSLGKGSSIDSLFANNSKSGNVNLSYGINASYNINKKLSVRTGINKVNLSYKTKDVISFQTLPSASNTSTLRNIKSANNTNNNIMFLSANSTSLSQAPSELASTLKASIDQELGFIEVPFELKYNLSNKKLGVNVIGGFSMLFLNDNNVYSVLNEVRSLLGEATNLNELSYSANVGLGLDFKMSESVNLNLNPMFKYQINTFNNTSGDFQPYFIGVYSGINVKF